MDRQQIRYETLNGLLDMLPKKDLAHLSPLLSLCELRPREVIASCGTPATHVYFPCNAIVASVVETGTDAMIEAAVTGAEGFAPIDAFFGNMTPGMATICKVGGACLRMRAEDFLHERDHSPCFRYVMQLYLDVFRFQLSQRAACARLHSLKARYARAILALRDRTGSPDIPITQDLLARLLGVHRPSLNEFARLFESEGAIRYMRGRMIVDDCLMLEQHACECYALTRHESERTLGMRAG